MFKTETCKFNGATHSVWCVCSSEFNELTVHETVTRSSCAEEERPSALQPSLQRVPYAEECGFERGRTMKFVSGGNCYCFKD